MAMNSNVTIIEPGEISGQIANPNGPDLSGAANDYELMDLWIASVPSRHTRRLYKRTAERFLARLPNGLRGATLTDIQMFRGMELNNMKPLSKHTMMSALRSFFKFAERTNYIVKSPAHVSSNKRPGRDMRERCLEPHEAWGMIGATRNERNKQMLSFLYGTGVRVSELCGLKWGDITWKVVTVSGTPMRLQMARVLGKGDVYRDVPVPAFAQLARPAIALDDDAVFTRSMETHPWPPMHDSSVRAIIREAAIRAGVKKIVTPHWFRHSASSHLQDMGIPPKDVQALLGHASLHTTTGYSHTTFKSAPGDILTGNKPT
jgi:site-specific recombinase XerD